MSNASQQQFPVASVSTPVLQEVDSQLTLLDQYAAVDKIELRDEVDAGLR